MFSDLLFLFLGIALGASVMKAAVDYKDRHLRREMSRTEQYRAQYEKTRVTLAFYQGSAPALVAAPNDDTLAPLPLDLFTQDDQEALNQGVRVVKTRKGGAR
jgi:hypothetical protein